MATIIDTTPTVRCSFCGKGRDEVTRIVAGAGVFICDECVRLCLTIIETPDLPGEPRIPAWDAMTDRQILEHLPRVAAVGKQVEENLRDWVLRLRERKVTWASIGAALGMTRQSAWERFSGEE
ncbi:ClpX C4-type zinc finger protein [Sphaerisporangium sp. NPDC005288]|uniref:ClpX C4-type zinc finger protein n=1 Tax=Sphaerisporangium sp. NPDC005288 TaxID=3155114 RepID=UPI0033B598B4